LRASVTRPQPRLVPLVATVLAAGATACSASPAMRAAERGDRPALSAALSARQARGDLSNGEAVSLAMAVADRELRTAPAQDAGDRIRDAGPCAHELDDALASRMKTHDAAGATAALARVEGRGLDVDDLRDFAGDPDPRWRALGARALVRPEDRPARIRALVDPDPLVRRQAARASRDAADTADLVALAEAARVDPVPIVRTEAVRAIAVLAPTPGGEVANVLRDLWTGGDDGLREDIALAWAGATAWGAGGEVALGVVVASQRGPGVIEAAAAVLRHHAADDVAQAALGQLVRAIEGGARVERIQALAEAPLDRRDLLGTIRKAATDEDLEVRVAALGRLAEMRDPGAVAALEPLAQPGSPVAAAARLVLAAAGDRRVQAWLEEDLRSERSDVKLAAATGLAELGVAARAAPLLADADASVRVRSACAIVVAERFLR
jgi:HEAT repeat protein